MTDNQRKFIEKDLADYELRQLLGAARMVKLFDEKKFGNPCSLFRDAIYLHTRNLYNFFHGCTQYDASVYEFTNHVFDVSLYVKWKNALHNHVLHIKDSRTNANNIIDGVHISAVALDFVNDIEKLWQDWIDVTTDEELKKLLKAGLEKAREDAKNDYDSTTPRLKDEK